MADTLEFGISGLAAGLLDGFNHPPAALDRAAARHQVGPDAVALAAVLAQPWAHVVLSGAATVDQLRSNLAATEVHLSRGELEELAASAEPPARYWQIRSELRWT